MSKYLHASVFVVLTRSHSSAPLISQQFWEDVGRLLLFVAASQYL